MAELKRFIYLIEGTRPDETQFTIFDDPKVIFLDILDAQFICNKWNKENPFMHYKPVLYFRSDMC